MLTSNFDQERERVWHEFSLVEQKLNSQAGTLKRQDQSIFQLMSQVKKLDKAINTMQSVIYYLMITIVVLSIVLIATIALTLTL